MELDIETFNPTKAEITALAEKNRNLSIKDLDDKEGYELVDAGRKELQQARINITKIGKDLRANAVKFQKDVIALENDLLEIITPLEKELKAQLEAIDIAKEKRERLEALPYRKEKLLAIEVEMTDDEILSLDDQAFLDKFNSLKLAWLEAKEAKLKEAEAKVEADRLENERKQKEALDHIAAQKKEAEEAESRKAEIEEAKKQAAEQARLDLEREAKEAEAIAEKKAKEEQEALEKKKKYQKFCAEHGYSVETQDDFHVIKTDKEITLYKKVGTLKI